MAKIDINHVVELIQDEIKLVIGTLKGKGSSRFSRTLALTLGLPAGTYFLLYGPAVGKLARLDNQLSLARTTATHADSYKQLKEQLSAAYFQLPLPKDRSNWLSETIKDALRAEGIVPSQFMPPTDDETEGIVYQNLRITMNVKFPELMAFLARVEATKPMIHVTFVDVDKKAEQIGRIEVNCGLSTIILTERF